MPNAEQRDCRRTEKTFVQLLSVAQEAGVKTLQALQEPSPAQVSHAKLLNEELPTGQHWGPL